MQGVAASHHDSAPMQPPGTSFGNRFRQVTRSFTRRRPSCVRTYWNRTEPESHRISSESRSHPGRRLFTRLLRGFGARSRIFAVQRSLSAAGPGRPAEFPNRVSQSLRHISPPLQRHTDESVLIAACRHRACVQPGISNPPAPGGFEIMSRLATTPLGVCACCRNQHAAASAAKGSPAQSGWPGRGSRARAKSEQVSFRRGRRCSPCRPRPK